MSKSAATATTQLSWPSRVRTPGVQDPFVESRDPTPWAAAAAAVVGTSRHHAIIIVRNMWVGWAHPQRVPQVREWLLSQSGCGWTTCACHFASDGEWEGSEHNSDHYGRFHCCELWCAICCPVNPVIKLPLKRLFLSVCRKEIVYYLTGCRKEVKARFPPPLTGPYRFGGATLANRLAASRNYERSCLSARVEHGPPGTPHSNSHVIM